MIVIPDYIAYPLITWGIAAVWFNRHKLFDEEDSDEKKHTR